MGRADRGAAVLVLRPESCLELGTAIGISAGYQGAALEMNRRGVLRSIDRSRPLIGHARELLAGLRITRVDLILGDFDEVLEDVAAQAAPIHMVFLDALRDHDPNLRQFRRLLPHLAPGAALVLVHRSDLVERRMAEAYPKLRTASRRRLAGGGLEQGFAAGQAASLGGANPLTS